MRFAGRLDGPGLDLRLIMPGGAVAVQHNPATLAAVLAGAAPGQWTSLWLGFAREQVFARCGGCGESQALPVDVQIRRCADR